MFKINCMNNISRVGTSRLKENYEFVDDPQLADAWMVRSANLHEMELPKSLLAIARAGAGTNNIPVEKCAERGIVVFNTPGANANAVKELVVCAMLLSCRDIFGARDWINHMKNDPDIAKKAEKVKNQFGGFELAGKTVGVIGLGMIGSRVANAMISLGCEVLGYDPYLSINAAWSLDRRIEHIYDLNELLAKCDFVTMHVPVTKQTKGIISEEALNNMKRGSVLINFARSELVDNDALADALRSGKIARYICDFANSSTVNMKNAIVLPHLGASTSEAEDNCALMAASELRGYLECGNIKNSVNYPNVNLGYLKEGYRLAVFHTNTRGVIGQVSQYLGNNDLNIERMNNVSAKENAYTLIEFTGDLQDSLLDEIIKIDHVKRARIIYPKG